MARFILHIGQSKTGTTAIQHFLSVNRGALRDRGILYPDIRNRGVFLGATDHNLVAWSLIGKHSPLSVSFEQFLEDVKTELHRNAALHTVILSAEAFLGEPHIWNFDSEDAWRQANREKIQTLRSLLQGHEVTILVYLRRQDYWVNSAFNHIIKIEGLVGRRLYSDIQQLIEQLAPRLDYAQELRSWSEHFSRDAMIVRPYERSQLFEGDAVSDFLAQTGLADHGSQFIQPDHQELKNPGLPRDVLEVKQILNRAPRSKPEERVLIWALQKIGMEMPSACPEWDFLLTASERRALVRRYAAANSEVAETYLVSNEGMLFRDPLPQEDEGDDYPGLRTERALEVMLRLHHTLKSLKAKRLYIRYLLGHVARRHFLRVYFLFRPLYRKFVR
jgi:capsular polysaccharide export protein